MRQFQAFVQPLVNDQMSDTQKAVAIYYAIRDVIRYNPYRIRFERTDYPASNVLQRRNEGGHCIDKAILLTACWRAAGIHARLGYANVRNHIGTEKIEAELGTDELVFHGYSEAFLNGAWRKATPAFNRELCEKQGVAPLEFDGTFDSIFQAYNRNGNHKFMEYTHDHGIFNDHPFEEMIAQWKQHYGHYLGAAFSGLR